MLVHKVHLSLGNISKFATEQNDRNRVPRLFSAAITQRVHYTHDTLKLFYVKYIPLLGSEESGVQEQDEVFYCWRRTWIDLAGLRLQLRVCYPVSQEYIGSPE